MNHFLPPPAARRAMFQRFLVCALLIVAIGVLDYVTGLEIRIFPLYFAPVAYMATALGAWPGVAVALVCTSVWLGSSLASGNPHAMWLIGTNATLQLASCVVVALMVARLRSSLHAAEDHARRDTLTGLANRRGLVERADVELARLARGAGPLVVACVDLDNFKAVNDREGHSSGDRVLQAVSRTMRANVRAVDVVARTGGDEFVLLLPEIDASTAAVVLERVRAEVPVTSSHVSATIGAVVLRPRARATLDEALNRADLALYEAKRAGKDRVVVVEGLSGRSGHGSARREAGRRRS